MAGQLLDRNALRPHPDLQKDRLRKRPFRTRTGRYDERSCLSCSAVPSALEALPAGRAQHGQANGAGHCLQTLVPVVDRGPYFGCQRAKFSERNLVNHTGLPGCRTAERHDLGWDIFLRPIEIAGILRRPLEMPGRLDISLGACQSLRP